METRTKDRLQTIQKKLTPQRGLPPLWLTVALLVATIPAPDVFGFPVWTGIVVHHTAHQKPSEKPKEYSYERCRREHTAKGWRDCGYNFIIEPDGRIVRARRLSWEGAHCGRGCNSKNIGIAFAGNFSEQSPASEQIQAFNRLVKMLENRYGTLDRQPHRHFKNTRCPGRVWEALQ